jgi:hypothetical protein
MIANKYVYVKKKSALKAVFQAAIGLALLVLGTVTARAADMCFLDDYNSTIVGQNFAFPAPNVCKSFNGYELGTNCIVSGTACGTKYGEVRFNLNTSCSFGYFGTSSFDISRLYSDIYQAGFGYACSPNVTSGNWTCTQWHIRTIPCPNPHALN